MRLPRLRVEPAAVEQRKGEKNKKGKELRATPSKMNFTAALPQKSHVSLKWRALEKTLQAPKQTHSRLTTALQRS